MACPTVTSIVVLAAAAILYPSSHSPYVNARLTEVQTERLPILSNDLHTVHIDFQTLALRAKLGKGSSFRFKNGNFHKTSKGGKRVRLVQTYAGYEVFGSTAVAELDMRGYFTGQIYGQVAKDLHRDIPNPESCVRDVNALVDRAIRLENLHRVDPKQIDRRNGERVILTDPEKPKAKIVYVVEFFYTGKGSLSFPVYYIEACSNVVLFHFDQVKNITGPYRTPNKTLENPRKPPTDFARRPRYYLKFKSERGGVNATVACLPSAAGMGGNPKSGQTTYNADDVCLPVSESEGVCTMESTYGKVIDNQNSDSRSKETVVTFNCDAGYSDATNGAWGVANDALFFGEVCGSFFKDRYGITALATKPRLVVHFKTDFANAMWTGTDMFFGDGDDEFYPFTVLDMVSHELAHGFTTGNSNLIYLLQMGGIDESFSDITAVATREYLTGEVRWTIAADLYKTGSKAIRYMNDPPKDGRSIKSIRRYYPLMNVHFSSGIFNYAFYKLVASENVNIQDGYDNFFVANRDLWGRLTRFRKGACNVMQASYDNGHDHQKVQNAFSNTGIKLRYCNHEALKATVFPGETRTDILVKRARSPILEIDMRKWRGLGVVAKAEDSSAIQILASTDGGIDDVIAKGNNYVEFPGNHTMLYVRLMSDSQNDVKVILHVVQDD